MDDDNEEETQHCEVVLDDDHCSYSSDDLVSIIEYDYRTL